MSDYTKFKKVTCECGLNKVLNTSKYYQKNIKSTIVLCEEEQNIYNTLENDSAEDTYNCPKCNTAHEMWNKKECPKCGKNVNISPL